MKTKFGEMNVEGEQRRDFEMKRITWMFQLMVVLSLILTACQGTPTPTAEPTAAPSATAKPTEAAATTPTAAAVEAETLYVNLVWHQHQPLYYKDDNGVYTRPWVRVHGTKDYYDMAALVRQYPDVHVTFNFTPVLIRQIQDYLENGAKDLYWVMAEKPAAELTEEEQRFILERFFDVNWKKILARYPRYQALLDKRGSGDAASINAALGTFTEQDYRDLQIWFNLAWFDPSILADQPLKALVDQGEGFSEEDKQIVFGHVLKVMGEILPLHAEMQQAGQIEVITTPYAHPILPLITNTALQRVGNPASELPNAFMYPADAVAHLEKSVEIYEDIFGQAPRGLWPGEGSVAQLVAPFIIDAGYQWMATGEPVLAKSLGLGSFTRDGQETVQEADALYRPYYVKDLAGNRMAVFFRDGVISDQIGFNYSGMNGKAGAEDLMRRLENIRAQLEKEGAEGPHVVSIILDGENAWENYDNDAIDFLSEMYRLFSEPEGIETITPSDYLAKFPEQRVIEALFPGAWFSPNYDTWIGESEENTAWNYLGQTRAVLADYERGVKPVSPEDLALAKDYMYLAEGSDWFWWYGTDQDSGQDSYFDEGYRALLQKVFETLGEPVPQFVYTPIIQAKPAAADRPLNGMSTPVIDGADSPGEWDKAAFYSAEGMSPATSLAYAIDQKFLYFRMTFGESLVPVERLGFYVRREGLDAVATSRPMADEPPVPLGIGASTLVEWNGSDTLDVYQPGKNGWELTAEGVGSTAASGDVREFAVPLALFPELKPQEEFRIVVAAQPANQLLPADGPAQVILPDLSVSTPIAEIADPENDDHGPGTYTYPTDGVFDRQVYDFKSLAIAEDDTSLIFRVGFYGPVPNPWNSSINLSLQTIDIYIDQDPGAGTGARLMLPGRNAALAESYGWDYALWAEGWSQQVFTPDANGQPVQKTEASFKVVVDPGARMVTIRIDKAMLGGGDPATWAYVVVVLGQEGYPSTGVWRVRNVSAEAAQWSFGGAPEAKNHTRIIDMFWPAEGSPTQEDQLSDFALNSADPGTLGPDDFAQIIPFTVAK